MPVSSHLVPCEERDGGLPPTSAAGAGNREPKDAQVDKTLVATGQLSAADGMIQSPSVTAGAVEHFAVIGKVARLGTINRAAIVEPIAPGRRRGDAHDQMTPVLPSMYVFGPSCWLSYTGYTVSIAAS
jgi:hypothetical protein